MSWQVASIDDVIKFVKTQQFNGPEPKKSATSELVEINCPACPEAPVMVKRCNEYSYVCPGCAYIESIACDDGYNVQTGDNHNVSSNSYMSFKPVGTRNQIYKNTMTKYTSEKDTYRDNQILALLKQYNFTSNNLTLPSTILDDACKMFITIKNAEDKKFVRRGNTRKGILGACIYAECVRAEITKTKAQIAELMRVDESHITNGWNELLQYHNDGTIELPKNVEPYEAFFNTYFEIFSEIPANPYKQFAVDLLKKMHKHGVTEVQQCNNTTKCIGIMYFISKTFYPDYMTHDLIQKRCGKISRATYLSIYNGIVRSMPTGWFQKLALRYEFQNLILAV